MNILFQKNASNNEKLFALFSVVWAGLGLYGVRVNFDSDLELDSVVVVGSLLSGVAVLYLFLKDAHLSNKFAEASLLVRGAGSLSLLLGVSAISWLVLARSIPAMYTDTFGSPHAELVQVTHKYGVPSKKCSPRIATTRSISEFLRVKRIL